MSSHYTLHLDKAREYYSEGNYEAARAATEHAMESALPTDGNEARTLHALCLRKLEYNDEAIAQLREIVEHDPSPEACAEYALMCAERNQCDSACRALAMQAIEADPDLPSAYLALFWCEMTDGRQLEALKNLKRGILRGGDFSEARAFEIIRGWCQTYCNEDNAHAAYELVMEIGDLFNTFDFIVLQARIADICDEHRTAVSYYKKALGWLRPGPMRNEILEAIAQIAI